MANVASKSKDELSLIDFRRRGFLYASGSYLTFRLVLGSCVASIRKRSFECPCIH